VRPSLVVALIVFLLLPLGVTAWLGMRLVNGEQEQVERQVAALLNQRLADHARTISGILEREATRLRTLTADFEQRDPEALRALTRNDPMARQLFVTGKDGTPRFPLANGAESRNEKAFLERTRQIWEERDLFHQRPPEEGNDNTTNVFSRSERTPEAGGWYAWHWGNGLNLLYWQRLPGGAIAGAEVDPLGLLADIVAALPSGGDDPDARIRLRDARGVVLYQWGRYQPGDNETARADIALQPPLESWRLEYLASPTVTGSGVRFQLISALLGLAVVLLAVGFYVYREFTRSVREARQRVNFVNQVSHELKTPLTNIRLYAELLQQDVAEEDASARRLSVIVSETQRLSRLIGNVLSFARGQRGTLQLNPRPAVLDDCVHEVLEQFRPGFEAANIVPMVSLGTPDPVALDADAVSQIIGNLFSNVEKYAASGGRIEVVTRRNAEYLELSVRDFGPGVPRAHQNRIFHSFYRVRNDVTEGVSGTGIGLAIARDLARLHGGELILTDAAPGACFVLTIPGSAS
jgi:signal transduction histidine kinase